MTRDEKLAHIHAWHDAMVKADDTIQPVIDALALCGEDPITNTVWQLQGDLTWGATAWKPASMATHAPSVPWAICFG